MKKTIVGLIMLFAITTMIVGCTSSTEEQGPTYADEAFLTSLVSGLEARWDLNEKYEKDDAAPIWGENGYPEECASWVKAELDAVAGFSESPFEDTKLQELAISYINCLKAQKEAVDKYCNIDYEKYDALWAEEYNERSKLIETFVNDYGLTVGTKYQDILDELLKNSTSVKEDEEKEKAIAAMVDGVEFTLESNDYGFKTYSAVIENTSGFDFSDFSLLIQLNDADEVIIEENYSSVSSFKNGQKAKFEFYTEEDFESYNVFVDWWNEA